MSHSHSHNNNNDIEIWGNDATITHDELPNRLDPYDDTEDSFFVGVSNFRIYGVRAPDTQRYIAEKFTRGPLSTEYLEECPICFENYDTTEANKGESAFPIGFTDCPMKFECGYRCCFGCFQTAYSNMPEQEELIGFRCFSCRQIHKDAVFMEITNTRPVDTGNDELVEILVEEAELANRSKDFFEKKYQVCMVRITNLITENAELKKKLSRAHRMYKTQKRKLLFPVVAEGEQKKIKLEEEEEDKDDDNE